MDISPIPTLYKKIYFRSKTEARWACFMDCLGVAWEYEPKTFHFQVDGEDVWYLPDFWLPGTGRWFEVKGTHDDREACYRKHQGLARETERDVLVFVGFPAPPFSRSTRCEDGGDGGHVWFGGLGIRFDSGRQWCVCKKCGEVGIEFEGSWDRMKCCQKTDDDRKRASHALGDGILAAYNTAWQLGDPLDQQLPFLPYDHREVRRGGHPLPW